MPFCQDCFAKYNCSGDCPAKTYEQTGDLLDPSKNWRCTINRGLLVDGMVEALDKSKGQVAKLETKMEENRLSKVILQAINDKKAANKILTLCLEAAPCFNFFFRTERDKI
jgi:hypothetical protein